MRSVTTRGGCQGKLILLGKALLKAKAKRDTASEAAVQTLLQSQSHSSSHPALLRHSLHRYNNALPTPRRIEAVMEEGMGRGVVSLVDVDKGQQLSSLPSICLMERTPESAAAGMGVCYYCLLHYRDRSALHVCPKCSVTWCDVCSARHIHPLECGCLVSMQRQTLAPETVSHLRLASRLYIIQKANPALLTPNERAVLQATLPISSAASTPASERHKTDTARILRSLYPGMSELEAYRLVSMAGCNRWELGSNNSGDTITALTPYSALCNHTCRPNAEVTLHATPGAGVLAQLRAIRPIKAGDPVSVSYFNRLSPPEVRERMGLEWGVDCGCSACAAYDTFTAGGYGSSLSHVARMQALLLPCGVCTRCKGPSAPLGSARKAKWMCLDCGLRSGCPVQAKSLPRTKQGNYCTNRPYTRYKWMHPHCAPYIAALRRDPGGGAITTRHIELVEEWNGDSAELDNTRKESLMRGGG
ncbi:hypothetical protein KIPB_005534 [Kipferlia bialata]|uniref:SET domain-containing protein n=1 Tax=Kipferlia bialata TaxID=797122 RepID=A0A9K3CX38_9EUKA|nr:hypothetical protein KIPB_005534 [Kipferlia bialata]|eukprot:g5534.t1